MTEITMALDEVRELAQRCLAANGCDVANAGAVAATITLAEGDGAASHGLFRLPGYVASLRSGKVNGAAQPKVARIAPGVLRVDGDAGFSPLALARGRRPLITAAREQGVAALILVGIQHLAALWTEVEPLAEADLGVLACTANIPLMAPAGAREAFFGTNPLAFGWPRRDGPPIVFDMAATVMARGDVEIAARDGHDLAPGIGLDAAGNPSIDAKAVLEGVMLPFGGHKGSAIAMMVELLAAGLIGAPFSYEAGDNESAVGGTAPGGEFMLAIDPGRFGDDGWLDHTEAFFERLQTLEGVRLPAARRHANRQRTAAEGIPVPAILYAEIVELTEGA